MSAAASGAGHANAAFSEHSMSLGCWICCERDGKCCQAIGMAFGTGQQLDTKQTYIIMSVQAWA